VRRKQQGPHGAAAAANEPDRGAKGRKQKHQGKEAAVDQHVEASQGTATILEATIQAEAGQHPAPSPAAAAPANRKKRGRSKAAAQEAQGAEVATGEQHQEAAGGGQQQVAAQRESQPTKAVTAATLTAARKREAALCALPIPACLEALYEAFVVVIRVYRFLLDKHVQPTWPLIVVAVRDLQPGAPILQVKGPEEAISSLLLPFRHKALVHHSADSWKMLCNSLGSWH
jgi:hypothetical protein